jgi:hypothetical protein
MRRSGAKAHKECCLFGDFVREDIARGKFICKPNPREFSLEKGTANKLFEMNAMCMDVQNLKITFFLPLLS